MDAPAAPSSPSVLRGLALPSESLFRRVLVRRHSEPGHLDKYQDASILMSFCGPRGGMMLTEMLMRPAAEACAWSAADFADDTDYVLALSPTHIAEVDDALASVLSRRIPLEEVQEQDFPLATLGPILKE